MPFARRPAESRRALLACVCGAAAALGLSAWPAWAAADSLPAQTASYRAMQTVTSSDNTITIAIAHSKGRERREITADGAIVTAMLIRPDLGKAFILQPAMRLMLEVDTGFADIGLDTAWFRQFPATVEGEEVIAGEKVRRYRISARDARGVFEGHVWSTSDGIDVKIDGQVSPASSDPFPMRVELTDIRRTSLDGALFDMPKDYTRMSLAPSEGRMPDALKDDAERLKRNAETPK